MSTKRWWECRRTLVALVGMSMLFCLGYLGREQVAGALVTIVMAIAGANAAEASMKHKYTAGVAGKDSDANTKP